MLFSSYPQALADHDMGSSLPFSCSNWKKSWVWFGLGYSVAALLGRVRLELPQYLFQLETLSVASPSSNPLVAWPNQSGPAATSQTCLPPDWKAVTTAFDRMVRDAYKHTFSPPPGVAPPPPRPSGPFNVSAWDQSALGGLLDSDRAMLARYYGAAESVFEYGLGESTVLAAHLGVPRYAGTDSDPAWVAQTRSKVPSHYRFYLGDIGETKLWGFPRGRLHPKAILNYQLAPLIVEPYPFDVYLVDDRFRLGCLFACFLHAAARGTTGAGQTAGAAAGGPLRSNVSLASPAPTAVLLLHDCNRAQYHFADSLFEIEFSGGRLCAYRRKPNTTQEQLLQLWERHNSQVW